MVDINAALVKDGDVLPTKPIEFGDIQDNDYEAEENQEGQKSETNADVLEKLKPSMT